VSSRVDVTGGGWTYGTEHELADWDCLDPARPLPPGYARSPDHTIVNSNGVAAQPNTAVYRYGGEVNTPPDEYPAAQADRLTDLVGLYPEARVNHRSNLHVHVRVPGLRDSLPLLKRVQAYVHAELPRVLPALEPIPHGVTPAERKRARRRRVSHQTFLTSARLARQLDSYTTEDFFSLEVPRSRAGVPLWHAQPRCCVNLRQLLQTDTVEFRHFPGTLDREGLLVCLQWCRDFLRCAMTGRPLARLWGEYRGRRFPRFEDVPFDEDQEVGYWATASGIGLAREEILANIETITARGWTAFRRTFAHRRAAQRAGALPRQRVP
jgi:hypothetical protein